MLRKSHEIPIQNKLFQPLHCFFVGECFCRKRAHHHERRCSFRTMEGGGGSRGSIFALRRFLRAGSSFVFFTLLMWLVSPKAQLLSRRKRLT